MTRPIGASVRQASPPSALPPSTCAPARTSNSSAGPFPPPASPGRALCSGTTSARSITCSLGRKWTRSGSAVRPVVGGLRSCHLAALDDRIKAAVVVAGWRRFPPNSRTHSQLDRPHQGGAGPVPLSDYPDVASLGHARGAAGHSNGSKDALFELGGVQASFDKLRACYRKRACRSNSAPGSMTPPTSSMPRCRRRLGSGLKKWV